MFAPSALKVSGHRSQADPGRIRFAFYGRKNRDDAGALRELARQFWTCERVVERRSVVTRCFYDLPVAVSEIMALAVRGAHGPSRHDGDGTNWSPPSARLILVSTSSFARASIASPAIPLWS
jgi:hypothetical protein